MFGQNEITKPSHFNENVADRAGSFLYVRELYYTLQGEGPFVGHPAIFIRLGGCNLRCHFCDTDFDLEKSARLSVVSIVEKCLSLIDGIDMDEPLVVITGGEPLLQNIKMLCIRLVSSGFTVQIETAGTNLDDYFYDYLINSENVVIVCSPKTGNLDRNIEKLLVSGQGYLKYVISDNSCISNKDGIPSIGTQYKGPEYCQLYIPHEDIPKHRIYMMPMDEKDDEKNRKNVKYTTSLCMEYGYNLSLQIHKLIGLE